MLKVNIRTSNVDIGLFLELANRIQGRFRFVVDTKLIPRVLPGNAGEFSVDLYVVNERREAPYTVDLEKGVTVSCYESAGICQYAQIDRETFILVCSLLGLVQWRSLKSNPLLRPEDLWISGGESCLFHRPETPQDYALELDERKICAGCFEFYCCLAVEPELAALKEALRHANESRVTYLHSPSVMSD